jgi:hypothetical protein
VELNAVEKKKIVECIDKAVSEFVSERLEGVTLSWLPDGFRVVAYFRGSLSATDWDDVSRAHRTARLRSGRAELDTAYACVLLRGNQVMPQPGAVEWIYRQGQATPA